MNKRNSYFTLALFVLCPLLLSTSISLASGNKRLFQGQIGLWSKATCEEKLPCGLPKPIEVSWKIESEYEIPALPGGHVVVNESLTQGEWKVQILQVWVNPENQSPYLATQARLSHQKWGFIAECNRYDSANAFQGLPPGSCSGRVDKTVFGMSFLLN